MLEYFKLYPSRSAKKFRLYLIPNFYFLKNIKAHLQSIDSLNYKT